MTLRMTKCLTSFGGICALMTGMALTTAAHADAGEWWQTAHDHVTTVAEQGRWDLYLSGYAYHSRSTYNENRIHKLNEKAWGGGFGKTYRNSDGDDESLYALAIRDSNRNIQYSAGYAYEWIYPVGSSGFEVGAGLTATIISRKDWFSGTPFPAILPVFSAGVKDAKIMGTFVPRLSTRHGKGDVLLLVLKATF